MKILITGANGGLGNKLAELFSIKEHNLILTVRANSINTIKEKFPKQTYLEIDFITDNINEKLKSINLKEIPDLIIHCAGGKIEGDEHPINSEILDKTIKLNCSSVIELNNYFIEKAIINNKNLRIIHISSDAGITGRASPSYSISKGALNTYIKNSGRFYAQENIMICGLICSIFEHKNSSWTKKKLENPSYYEEVKKSTALKRFASVEEIAEIVIDISKSKSMLYSSELINITAGNI